MKDKLTNLEATIVLIILFAILYVGYRYCFYRDNYSFENHSEIRK